MKIHKGTIYRIQLVPGSPFVVFQVNEPLGTHHTTCHILKAETNWFCAALRDSFGCSRIGWTVDFAPAIGREIYFGLHPTESRTLECFSPVERASRELVALHEAQEAPKARQVEAGTRPGGVERRDA